MCWLAEERALPASEGMPGHRHGNRHIDADHADLDAPRKFTGRSSVARVARDAIAELVRVDQFDRAVEIGHADHAQDRSEDLLLVDAHVGVHVVEQSAGKEEPALATRRLESAPVDDQLWPRTSRHLRCSFRSSPCARR